MLLEAWNGLPRVNGRERHAAFRVGNAERLSLDAGGVALAAIQGLNQVARDKEARIARFEAELAELRQAGP